MEEAVFDADEAAEAPVGGSDLVDQDLLLGGGGIELVVEGGEELEEVRGGLVGQNGVAGEEAMFEGVEAGLGLALGCFGPGAAPGVGAIGVDLLLRWHKCLRGAPCEGAPPVLYG